LPIFRLADYIGGRVFYSGYSEECVRSVLASSQVNDRIRLVAEQQVSAAGLPPGPQRDKRRAKIEADLQKDAEKIANGLVTRMDNVRFLRGFGVSVAARPPSSSDPNGD
jgi:hypothetical protein